MVFPTFTLNISLKNLHSLFANNRKKVLKWKLFCIRKFWLSFQISRIKRKIILILFRKSSRKDWKLKVVESSRLHFCLLIGGWHFDSKSLHFESKSNSICVEKKIQKYQNFLPFFQSSRSLISFQLHHFVYQLKIDTLDYQFIYQPATFTVSLWSEDLFILILVWIVVLIRLCLFDRDQSYRLEVECSLCRKKCFLWWNIFPHLVILLSHFFFCFIKWINWNTTALRLIFGSAKSFSLGKLEPS